MIGNIEWLVILTAVVCIAVIGVRAMGVKIPPFFIQILWIVFVAAIVIIGIRLLTQII